MWKTIINSCIFYRINSCIFYQSCRLTSKLLRQGYERFKLISAFKKFYGRHKILVDRYKVSVTHTTSDLFLETLYLTYMLLW